MGSLSWVRTSGISVVCLLTATCSYPPSLLEQVLELGYLTAATRNTPTTYYQAAYGPGGPEYELVSAFAESLGVEARMVVPPRFQDVVPAVISGSVHLAAAGLSVTDDRWDVVRFGPAYQMVRPQVVYRVGERRPRSPEDLLDQEITVMSGSAHAERLRDLRRRHPGLQWTEESDIESEELLYRVSQRELAYTVADSNEVALNRRFYPELRVGFDVGPSEALAWVFAQGEDDSLIDAATGFFEQIEADGSLDRILRRYYGAADRFDYVGTRTFLRHIDSRLPQYRVLFFDAARDTDLDWRLLAAIAYQESHWDEDAVSYTGVRGLMMLTTQTAEQVGIADRTDPASSVTGGARYLAWMKTRIPERIPEPDRTWMALAAYNVGLGHLEDARILAQARGLDPDHWPDVRDSLPLLSQQHWYRQTRFGYARGREPVQYVDNIRSYYDVLIWMTSDLHRNARQPVSDETGTAVGGGG
jgi:peptidoglycan lytic transglycosylase F